MSQYPRIFFKFGVPVYLLCNKLMEKTAHKVYFAFENWPFTVRMKVILPLMILMQYKINVSESLTVFLHKIWNDPLYILDCMSHVKKIVI